MGTFIIWLVIVALILLKSARQNKQEKAKNAKNTKGYTYPKTHPTESYPKSSPVSRKHSKPQEPKENVFTRAKRNVSEDFSKDKLSNPTEFSKDVLFEALYNVGVNIRMIATSEIRITVLIDEADVDTATKAVHDKFIED